MNCQHLVEAVTEYLEGALAPAQRDRLDAHLAECPACERYIEQIRLTARATGRIGAEALSDEAVDRLSAVFARWRSEDGQK